MTDYDYVNKEFIDSFYFNTKNDIRNDEIEFINLGRTYIKEIEYQPVYLVGVMYLVENRKTKELTNMLLVGIAKCPTNELNPDEDKLYAEAEANAYSSPLVIIKDIDNFDQFSFEEMCNVLVLNMTKLDYMMTKEEIDAAEYKDWCCCKAEC